MLELVLEGEQQVDNIILSDDHEIYSRELMHSHLDYIRKLWNGVKTLESRGKTLPEIQDQLSLDKDFSFVKDMDLYKTNGDAWIRPQHEMHIKLFYLQGKKLVSEIIRKGGIESLQASIKQIKEHPGDFYSDEMYMNQLGYAWMNSGHISAAIEVFKLNTEFFPGSSNVYDSLGEAYMKNGDSGNATINYNKSLELNPDNRNAKEMLMKLVTN
jgi:tetratricopeptide (TPR) repeat protein